MQSRLLICCTLLLLIGFAGCKKEKASKTDTLTNQQAANIIGLSLANNSNGLALINNDVVVYAKALPNANKGCGVLDSFAIARQDVTSSTVGYNYAMGYHYTVNCVNQSQDNLSSNVSYNGSFDAPYLSVMNSGAYNTTLAPLSGSATNYTSTGTYTSSGSYKAIDDTNFTGDFALTINVKNLLNNKSSRSISGGTATIQLTGSVKNKNTFSFNGSLTFTNSSTAALTLEGVFYTINLTTGMATPNATD